MYWNYYNQYYKRNILAKQLIRESKLVQEESMAVLAEFERLSYED